MTTTIIRGGRLVDIDAHAAPLTDILVEDGTIIELGPPDLDAPEAAAMFDASGMLMHPGLINGHTHGHGNLAKGRGTAGPSSCC